MYKTCPAVLSQAVITLTISIEWTYGVTQRQKTIMDPIIMGANEKAETLEHTIEMIPKSPNKINDFAWSSKKSLKR